MKFVSWIILFPALALLASCAAGPRTLEPVPFYLLLSADGDINPDLRGRPTPVVVRIYELRNSGAFESADFFSLFEREQAILGGDLLQRQELTLQPGESRQISRRAHPEARAIGVVAAFHNLERSRWRALAALPPPKEVSNLPVIGRYVTLSPREQQILIRLKSQSLHVSQEKAPLLRW